MVSEALFSSDRGNWETPDNVLSVITKYGPIVLDPCTTNYNPCGACLWYHPDDDGLQRPWYSTTWPFQEPAHNAIIFVNPPYGRKIGPWIRRCGEGWGYPIIALVPARPDTEWWQTSRANAVCFWRGRIKFRGAKHPAPFPSAFLYWGSSIERFRTVFERHGQVAELR